MKIATLLFALIPLTGCFKKEVASSVKPPVATNCLKTQKTPGAQYDTCTPVEEAPKVMVMAATGFTDNQMTAINNAVKLAEKALQDPDFKKILTSTNEQKLIEALSGNATIKLTLKFYRPKNPFTSAIAYTENGTIHLNKNGLSQNLADLAGTLIHEFTHTLGYTHPFKYTPERDKTIPYLVGYAIADAAKKP